MRIQPPVRLPGGRYWTDPRNCPHVVARAASSLAESLAEVVGVRGVTAHGNVLMIECDRELSAMPSSWSGFTVLVQVK